MKDYAPIIRRRRARRADMIDAALCAVCFPILMAECYVILAMLAAR